MLSRADSVSAFLDSGSDADQDCSTIASNTFKIMWSTRRQQIFKLSILINVGFILYLMLRSVEAPTKSSINRLQSVVPCHDRDPVARTRQHGDYWVLENFFQADRPVKCYETVTFTTHATYDYLGNIKPLVKRWMAPVSVAVFAPGSDLVSAVRSIRHLTDCSGDDLVRNLVTFHLFFPRTHMPEQIPKHGFFPKHPYNCTEKPPFQVINRSDTYMNKRSIMYPINVARNIAKDTALTHFILAADIELYPSPNVVPKFLNMIARNKPPLCRKNPRVYPMPVFEIDSKYNVPLWKKEIQMMVANKVAFPLKSNVCRKCNMMPELDKWMAHNESVRIEEVLAVSKQHQEHMGWQPVFIGTSDDAHFDERAHRTSKQYRSIQGYIFCVKNYDLMILSDAFLCHKPSVKTRVIDQPEEEEPKELLQDRQDKFDNDAVLPELMKLYGFRPQCINYKKYFDVT
ncbi:hypothetical protein JYU34_005918 [Plutella xylostella]|uniref:N-acetyllactosaminide beta-1,3-N-acetylglucosaminyltransferase n=1 Tax=Plutella xylostella TaxID=51655 RepID=A0ABQ7QUG7_PLUXY|nr:hypothetical protein JYU34_005918 [Plutella xylostella]